MEVDSKEKVRFLIPTILLVVNIIFTAFLIEELIDASEPNAGNLGLLTPVISIISFLYIKFIGKNLNIYLKIVQLLNGIFILFPILVLVYGIFIMINY